jgi:hypothetical protein
MQFTETQATSEVHDHAQGNPEHFDLKHQSWNAENLCVESYHEEILYYTSRWDALCPYVNVSPEMIAMAQKPFIVYAIPPESPYGVPINDKYGLVHAGSEAFWTEERRSRKFKELDKLCKDLVVTTSVIAGKNVSVEDVYAMGGEHFANYYIHDQEVEGFVDYIRTLVILLIRVTSPEGVNVLTDVSVILPKYNQLYGSFCQWNREFKNKSPGIFACLLACRWARDNGLQYYNLGPVDDYGYKALFVTDYEPIYALALVDPDHPLAQDPTSPLKIDFKSEELNQIYRSGSAPIELKDVAA